jgi:hypothetical protein
MPEEDSPMEVHPPHHAVHTVREFMVHMLAIMLGLLLAIGLEQTVEELHRLHERHQLEEDMRAEAASNFKILSTHLDVNIPELVQYRADVAAVRTAVPRGGYVDIKLPPLQMELVRKVMFAPEHNVWPVALSSGASSLLPEPLAQMYSHVDFNATEDTKEVDRIREAAALLTRFSLATGYALEPNESLHLTLTQRDQLLDALSTYAQQLYQLLRRDNLYMNDCQGILNGLDTIQSMEDWSTKQPLRISQYRDPFGSAR